MTRYRHAAWLALAFAGPMTKQPAGAQEPPLHQAIRNGNLAGVRPYLKPEFIRAAAPNGQHAIHVAVQHHHLDVAELLLKHGADVNARDGDGKTALALAVAYDFPEGAELLLRHKADVNASKGGASELLHKAAEHGHTELTRRFLAAKADPNTKGYRGRRPLHTAIEHHHDDLALLLIRGGANIQQTTDRGGAQVGGEIHIWNGLQTPLHYACGHGRTRVVEALLAKKANPNVLDSFGRTPLSDAVLAGSAEIVKLLLDAGADPNLRPPKEDVQFRVPAEMFPGPRYVGLTPLHFAAESGRADIVGLLLAKKAAPNARADDNGHTPLHRLLDGVPLAARFTFHELGGRETVTQPDPKRWRTGQREKALLLLLDAGADPSLADNSGHTPAYYAHKYAGATELPAILARRGVAVSFLDAAALDHVARLEKLLTDDPKLVERAHGRMRDTALHRAAAAGATRAVKLLLDRGAKVDAANGGSKTALHLAVEHKCAAAVKLLLDRGAAPALKDHLECTPLDWAIHGRHAEAVRALMSKRAALGDDAYRRALHQLVETTDTVTSSAAVLRELLAHRGGVKLDGEFGGDLLVRVIGKTHLDMAQAVLDHGAPVNQARAPFPPLHAAALSGKPALIRLLLAHKADVHARDRDGATALHVAASRGDSPEAVRVLLEAGADPSARDRNGRTAADLAQRSPRILEVLGKHAKQK